MSTSIFCVQLLHDTYQGFHHFVGFTIKEAFLEKSEKIYGSKPVTLGPNKKDNLDSINKWVSDATKGKIKNFLSDLPEKVALIILNAIHFKGKITWRLLSVLVLFMQYFLFFY